jgi:integrase
MAITTRNFDTLKLPEGKRDHVYWDDELTGFGLRIIYTGARKWCFRFRFGGKQTIASLGPATKDNVAAARKRAIEWAGKVKDGINPLVEKAAAIQEANQTFGSLVGDFLARRGRDVAKGDLSKGQLATLTRHLNEGAAPLHSIPVTRVLQADIAKVLNTAAEDRGDISANRHRASLSKFYTWVQQQGVRLPEGNPVQHTEKRQEQPRKRVLTHDELRRIWNASDPTEDYGAILRLLMLTGQRRDEIAKLRWSEVKEDYLELKHDPANNRTIKNGRNHFVPLSDAAHKILAGFPRKGRVAVFGENGMSGYGNNDLAKKALDKRIGDMPHWTLHDLRRTMATLMGRELRVQPHVIECILNHVSGHKSGVAGVYQPELEYHAERREALNDWAKHLADIVAGHEPKVVSINRNRAA